MTSMVLSGSMSSISCILPDLRQQYEAISISRWLIVLD